MNGSIAGPVGYARFLYWHRAYVLKCENALQEIDATITIPCWDWLNANTVPSELAHMPIRGVRRNTASINFTNDVEIEQIVSKGYL